MIPVYDINNVGSIPDNDITFQIDDQLFLEVLMMAIRGKSISHSAYIQKSRNQKEKELEDLIKKKWKKMKNWQKSLILLI
jgi:hypothetical protein